MNENNDLREPHEVCDQITSLTISGPPETTGVTSFVQEACTAVSAIDSKYSTTDIPLQLNMQDVRAYFARPTPVLTGTVPTGSRTTFAGGSVTWPTLLSYWTTGQARLLGAFGIRATIVYTLQVSATPFHQGLIALAFQYGYNTNNYNRFADSCTVTNLPHVVLDLSSDTMVQLKLPYLYTAEYCDIRGTNNVETAYGQVGISTLANVPSVSGMGLPTYQLYLHLEDIQLFGVTPQSTSTVVLNAGKKLSPVTEEFESDSHPYSSALHAAGRAVGFVAKGVPSLATLAGPTAWAPGKAAMLARYFGFGKPQVTDPVMRVARLDTVGEFNTDVATSTMVLAATANNMTSIHTGVGASDVDEMSLAYICSRWGQINVFDITTSVASGTLLYATPISPLSFWFRTAGGSLPASNKHAPVISSAAANSIQPSHLMFAASSFKQWRGGVKFRFTFVKTKMHAGRVIVTYNPQVADQTLRDYMTNPTGATIPAYSAVGPDPFAYSAIFDLKDSNVFEFEVPYVTPLIYTNISSVAGFLAMYVVNPVIASAVVSNTISCVVEVAGMPDFELSNPVGCLLSVHNKGTIQVQSGRVISETYEQANQHTMGEAITSVKQLISIPHVSNLGGAAGSAIFTTVPPWYYQPTPSSLVPAVGIPSAGSFSYGGNWASCYTFLKGGTDLHIYDTSQTSSYYLSQCPQNGGILDTLARPCNRGNSNSPVLFTTENNLHARLPGFFPTKRVNTWIANALTSAGVNWLGSNPYSLTSNPSPYVAIQAIWALRIQPDAGAAGSGVFSWININAADDAQLAMYIGPPPVFLPASASATGAYDVDSNSLLSTS